MVKGKRKYLKTYYISIIEESMVLVNSNVFDSLFL